MTRWKPDGRERLQEAAVELFLEHGYDAVTVAEIAERAGLTKRSFFNHFPDKREVLFAGAVDFEVKVLDCLRAADHTLPPFDAAVVALGKAGRILADLAPYASMRRDLIESSVELRERALIKSASLSAVIATALVDRGASTCTAQFAAGAAVAAFSAAYDDWGGTPNSDFAELMDMFAGALRSALLQGGLATPN